jgi:hypothetical protein
MFAALVTIILFFGLGQASFLRANNHMDTEAIASIMGKNSLYTSIVRSLKHDAPAKVIVKKMDELQGVLSARMVHVKEGCEVDTNHFTQRLLIVADNITNVNASLATAKRCIEAEIATEKDISEEIAADVKTLVPQAKFENAKLRLAQIRRRATKLMKAHDARHDRYQKEQLTFKEQDKILTHVMDTIESYYKKKSVKKEATQKSERTVQTELLEMVAPKSKVHAAVVTKLLEIVSNKTKKVTPQQQQKGTEDKPVVAKKIVTQAAPAAKGKVLAGTIYEAITELKGTFVNEQKIRTLRYETRKDEHLQEIQTLSKEEGDIKSEVTSYISNNKNVTKTINGLKEKLNKALDKQKECKVESTDLAKDLTKLKARHATRKYALNHTKTLCTAQLKDILKEIKLSNYISGLIQKRVQKIQKALLQFEKNSADDAGTGATGATGNSNSVVKLESSLKNVEECTQKGVSFWCASEENMKKCAVNADVCKRMKASEVNLDLSVNAATGAASGAASGATGVDSIRKQRLQKAKKNGGVTGPSSNGDKLRNAAATGTLKAATGAGTGPGAATGPSANKASSSTGVALSKKQKHDDFMKLLKIFDQNSNKHIGWDEIVAVTGHDDPKMKKEFQAAAGPDMQMDYKEFHKFMNKEENAKFFFM